MWKKTVLISFIVETVALLLAIASGGAGHGDYFFAKLLFPWEMYLGQLAGHIGTIPIVLCLIHYPALFFVFGWIKQPFRRYYLLLILSVYVVFWFLTFLFPDKNFG